MPEDAQKTATEYPPMQQAHPTEAPEAELKHTDNTEPEPSITDNSEAKNEALPLGSF